VVEDREAVAYHEAGHAVVAYVVGLTVERVSIQSDGIAAGHVEHDYGCNMNNSLAK
jgi:ATP-dependent Zn protease